MAEKREKREKKKKKKNKMASHWVEATGLRVIGMYVQEYFHWGWQTYDQANDDGIDGEIIPRYKNGEDMGVRIKVQSKSGPSFLKNNKDSDIIKIQPYTKIDKLIQHINSWNRSNEPVILVYTNALKINKKGNEYLDLKNPSAWWIRMDNYEHDGSSFVRIPRENLFQEHSKGELVKLIKPYIKVWPHCLQVILDEEDMKLWNSLQLIEDAKMFYNEWKFDKPTLSLYGNECQLIVSRKGWRHITNKARKDRVELSLKMLPIAKKILELSEKIRPVELRPRTVYKSKDYLVQHLGYRARAFIDGSMKKVQVVVKRYKNQKNNKEKVWFYSVHIVK